MVASGEVETTSLDDWMSNRDSPTTLYFVKIDIEGAEMAALSGARQTIERHRPIILIELWPQGLEAHGARFESVTEFFEDAGYDAIELESKTVDSAGGQRTETIAILPSRLVRPQGNRHTNVLFVPR